MRWSIILILVLFAGCITDPETKTVYVDDSTVYKITGSIISDVETGVYYRFYLKGTSYLNTLDSTRIDLNEPFLSGESDNPFEFVVLDYKYLDDMIFRVFLKGQNNHVLIQVKDSDNNLMKTIIDKTFEEDIPFVYLNSKQLTLPFYFLYRKSEDKTYMIYREDIYNNGEINHYITHYDSLIFIQ